MQRKQFSEFYVLVLKKLINLVSHIKTKSKNVQLIIGLAALFGYQPYKAY